MTPAAIVLLQLGNDQICVYDPDRRQIAVRPIAVVEKDKSNKAIDSDEEQRAASLCAIPRTSWQSL